MCRTLCYILYFQYDIDGSSTETAIKALHGSNSGCANGTSLPILTSCVFNKNSKYVTNHFKLQWTTETTTEQSACPQRPRLTASVLIDEVVNQKAAAVNNSFNTRLFANRDFKSSATQYGKLNEEKAINKHT